MIYADPAEAGLMSSCLAFAFMSSVARLVGVVDKIGKP